MELPMNVRLRTARSVRTEKIMKKKTFKLCYIKNENCAYFTTRDLDKQTGDDWGDAPYQSNAGAPYEASDYYNKEDVTYKVIHLYFESSLDSPGYSPYISVDEINNKAVPWLEDRYGNSGIKIWAGTSLDKFKKIIKEHDGKIFVGEE